LYIHDSLGPPQKLIAQNGEIVWSARYDAFGKATVDIATVENNLRFPGQYFDTETGLHYNWHRYYDPEIGRYLTPDPIGLDGGINLYVYVGGDPVNGVDPWGLTESDGGELGTGSLDLPNPIFDTPNSGVGFGAEAHFVYGYGRDTFFCCDDENNLWRVRTSKHCLGAGFVASGGVTASPGRFNRKNCPDSFGGWAAEFGAGPLEAGLGISKGVLLPTGGVSAGIGGKATMCYYRILEKKKIGCCE
jgi:RHS repeat-associated protein